MEKAIENYKTLKRDLEDFQKQPSTDEDFVKLVSMKGVDDDLKETLILLHSNYKAENKEQKSQLIRLLYRLVDSNLDVFEKLSRGIRNQTSTVVATPTGGNVEVSSKPKGTPLFQLGKVHTIILVVVMSVVAFFVLAMVDPEAFQLAMQAMKDIINLGKS